MDRRDVLVHDADLVDGTGTSSRRVDILVRSGVIEAVEPTGQVADGEWHTVYAAGRTVTPGFIDVHSHADNAPFLNQDDTSKILQGVTTEVVGNCGFSLAPRTEDTGRVIEDYALRIFPPVPWSWHTFAELLSAADSRGYVTNYAALAGHHALRIAAMAMDDRAPDERERDVMAQLLDEALEAGAFGLSTGLIYPPGLFSETEELVELARRLPPGRPYVTHMRGEGPQLLSSIAEAIRIGEETGSQVQISHLKSSGRPNWGVMGTALQMLDDARERGVDVRHDVYPYTAGSTMLTATLPPWFQEGGDGAVLRRLSDPNTLERLRVELATNQQSWENFVFGAGWNGIVVASSASHRHDGESIEAIAVASGQDPFDALVDILREEELKVSMIVHSMNEADLEQAMVHRMTMIGSDGLPPGVGGKPHPRMYGTFPRVLARYVRERGVLTLAAAVRKMTSLPAETFGLTDRGTVAPGMVADLVAFDPAAVLDVADYQEPTQQPRGIDWVMQAGRIVVQDGAYVGGRWGQRLRPVQ
jgi:N-acyl-D-aspartate/D-glutamate deacylase